MRIIASGYVWDARDAPFHRRTCVRTNVALAEDGTLYVAFRWGSARESPDGHEGVIASTDLGETWERVDHDLEVQSTMMAAAINNINGADSTRPGLKMGSFPCMHSCSLRRRQSKSSCRA